MNKHRTRGPSAQATAASPIVSSAIKQRKRPARRKVSWNETTQAAGNSSNFITKTVENGYKHSFSSIQENKYAHKIIEQPNVLGP
jgi:hypothetical protein